MLTCFPIRGLAIGELLPLSPTQIVMAIRVSQQGSENALAYRAPIFDLKGWTQQEISNCGHRMPTFLQNSSSALLVLMASIYRAWRALSISKLYQRCGHPVIARMMLISGPSSAGSYWVPDSTIGGASNKSIRQTKSECNGTKVLLFS